MSPITTPIQQTPINRTLNTMSIPTVFTMPTSPPVVPWFNTNFKSAIPLMSIILYTSWT